MSSERRSVEEIFNEALKLPPEERVAFLEKTCSGDTDLHKRVEALLQAHGEANSFLESPVLDASPTALLSEVTEGPGTSIGRYKLLQMIGEGGFGVVYMAEQEEPVHRKVALKIIKLGMDTKQVIARFEAERQALALMDHPNIARVFDAGATETGRPYFVMELVRGIPITEYCERNHLSTQERLQLFVQVCRAVQHAHQNGIIHRDIKPNNVLVTLHDSKPVPKVIDFGIAKATSQRLTEKTLFTEFGLFIGTPQYMSPDQAAISGLDVDTRTDIYSLGVLLYELLTGSTPFDADTLHQASYAEILHIIRDVDPPRPSTRLQTLLASGQGPASKRPDAPADLTRSMRGDLDWIVMKAMEKDRTRRYETAVEMVADIQRYIDDEPVLATPPTLRYRISKFVRRHRVGVLAASLVSVALVAGLLLATYGLLGARREAQRSQRIVDFLGELLLSTNADQAMGHDVDVEGVLTKARELFGDDHATVAAMLSSRALQLQSAGELEAAENHYRESLRIWREFEGDETMNVADAYRALGLLQRTTGDHVAAEESFRKSIRITRSLGKETLPLAETLGYLGDVLSNLGEYGEALECMEEAVQIRRRVAPHQLLQMAIMVSAKVNLMSMSGSHTDMDPVLREVIQAWREALPARGAMMASVLTNCAVYYYRNQDLEQAAALWGEALDIFRSLPESAAREHFIALQGMSAIHRQREEVALAAQVALEAVEAGMRMDKKPETECCGPSTTEALNMLRTFSWRLVRDADRPAAEYEIARQCTERYLELQPEGYAVVNTLGVAQYRLGQYHDALQTLARSDAHFVEEQDGGIVEDVAFISMAYQQLGRQVEANAAMERLQDLMQQPRCANDPESQALYAEAQQLFAALEGASTP